MSTCPLIDWVKRASASRNSAGRIHVRSSAFIGGFKDECVAATGFPSLTPGADATTSTVIPWAGLPARQR
jgi:hypothetical protein